MENKKENSNKGPKKSIIILIISVILILGIISIIIKISNGPVLKGLTQNIPPLPSSPDPETSNSSLDSNFICPENYNLSAKEKDDAMKKSITDYLKEFPKASISDILTYRYSMLVKKNCKVTLDFIKSQANGDDPLTSYIEKTLESME